MTRRTNYEVVSIESIAGRLIETGRCGLTNHTIAEAKKFARAHSGYWPDKVVTLASGHFPLHSFHATKETTLTPIPDPVLATEAEVAECLPEAEGGIS